MTICNITQENFTGYLVAALIALFTLFREFQRFSGKGEKHEVTNDPLVVAPQEKWATATGLSNHVTRDLKEHEAMRNETARVERELVDRISALHTDLMQAGETREQRLLDTIQDAAKVERERVDKVMVGLAELKGMMQYLTNIAAGKKGGA